MYILLITEQLAFIGIHAVVLRIVKLSKQGGSDQTGYVISSHILADKYLQVTEQGLGSKKRAAKFTDPKQVRYTVEIYSWLAIL